MSEARPSAALFSQSMASTPWLWLSTMTYWSRSPRTASTAFSYSAGTVITSATSPITPFSDPSEARARVIRLRTPRP